jgi:DNA-binding PadR family transcriptional regulator
MPKSAFLGEFEQVLLLALARLEGTQAYGMAIRREIEERTGQDVAIGSVYAALDRLQRRGFISSGVGDPTPQRGGRAKRYYSLRRPGAEALARCRDAYAKLWDGLELDPEAFAQ